MDYAIFYELGAYHVKRKAPDGTITEIGTCQTYDHAVRQIAADSGQPVVLTALTSS